MGEEETNETEERRGRLHTEGSAIRRANTLPARGATGQSQPLQSVGLRDYETHSLADYHFPLSLRAEGWPEYVWWGYGVSPFIIPSLSPP